MELNKRRILCVDYQSRMQPIPPVTILDTTYPALADGVYDAIILGTGLKECIIAGLLATEGKKVFISEFKMSFRFLS